MSHNHDPKKPVRYFEAEDANPFRAILKGFCPTSTYGDPVAPTACPLCGGDPFIKDEAGLIITECEECRKAGRLG